MIKFLNQHILKNELITSLLGEGSNVNRLPSFTDEHYDLYENFYANIS